MRFIGKLILPGVLFGLAVRPVAAGEIRTGVTSYNQDRLYFPVGEEAHVYEHARFTVYYNEDSVYSGLIGHSWWGVAVSDTTGGYFDSHDVDSLEAVIETADLDSLSPIRVGTDIVDLQLLADTTSSDRVEIREYDDRLAMLDDFQSGLLDGTIEFKDLSPKPAGVITISSPLPYIAALIPNVRKEANYQGQLTTSLYYRFDQSRLAIGFDGDRAEMVFQLAPIPETQNSFGRLYQYDPERGRRLFSEMIFKPTQVNLYSGNPALDGLALYFADVISRDRCPVGIAGDRRAADVRIEFIPISEALPSATVYALYHELVIDSVAGMVANEHVRRIAVELRFVESPPHPADYYRHLNIAGRIMIEDLGVFPLFRPTVFLHTHKRLQNVLFDDDGRLDFAQAVLVQLPQPPQESSR